MDGLRQKLENQGLKDVVYMVVNDQAEASQLLHPFLEQRLSENIALYKQSEHQPHVWQILNGRKDDFFIYDRCGRLTHHISLPYSVIGLGHIESAIKEAYCSRICGECSYETIEPAEECTNTAVQPDANPIPPDNTDVHIPHQGQGHRVHHGRRHHGQGHHGHSQSHPSRDHNHNHGHHHGNQDGVAHSSDPAQSQQHVEALGQHDAGLADIQHQLEADQQAVLSQQGLQEVDGVPVRP